MLINGAILVCGLYRDTQIVSPSFHFLILLLFTQFNFSLLLDFGEMLFWWSTYFAALPSLLQLAPAGSSLIQKAVPVALGAISPMFVSYLLMNVSGIPIHERNQKKKHGSNPAYLEYVKNTNLLLPLPKF